jgi:5'(3')-deoxyribonucleotidase
MDWTYVLNSDDVDLAYGEFWRKKTALAMMQISLSQKNCSNKNIHKWHPFMTQDLLIFRNTKNKLHKKAIADPNPLNIQNYKRFKTIYFRTLRGAKKLHITNKLNEMWEIPKKH